jgi:8-oxo-dGTP diphosphatase
MTQPAVVGAAIIREGRLLAARRLRPATLAGYWEFPGGKVEPGEIQTDTVRRECREELGVDVAVGERIGPEVTTAAGAALRVYLARLADDAEPAALEHSELRWLSGDELDGVAWIEADVPIVAAVRAHLHRLAGNGC